MLWKSGFESVCIKKFFSHISRVCCLILVSKPIRNHLYFVLLFSSSHFYVTLLSSSMWALVTHHLCMISVLAVFSWKFLTFGNHNYSQASQLTNLVSRIFMTDYSDKQFLGITRLAGPYLHEANTIFIPNFSTILYSEEEVFFFSCLFFTCPLSFLDIRSRFSVFLSSPPVPLPFSETAL